MKIHIKNLGVIQYAEIDISNMTIICGMNNSGKTYIVYAIYGFLYFWANDFEIPIDDEIVKKLRKSGVCSLLIDTYATNAKKYIDDACDEYTSQLPWVFSSKENSFINTEFKISISPDEINIMQQEYIGGIKSADSKTGLTVQKKAGADELLLSLFSENNEADIVPDLLIFQIINNAIKKIIFNSLFPNVFIASAERTGAAIFRRELNFARNKILDVISKNEDDIDPFFLLKKSKSDYAWPVDHNVDFARSLEKTFKTESKFIVEYKDVLFSFSDILGGEYLVTDKDELYFIPANKTNKKTQLTMDESSSSVRSLLDIGFYLKHVAQIGDLLIIDEPELNLHPNNQRKIARLIASLINCGIKIMITTHSDYILREINNLILLNGDSPHLSKIIINEGYKKTELLKASDIRVYIAGKNMIKLPDKQRKSMAKTLIQVDVDDDTGIHYSSFDETINEMNRIADEIVFGG